MRPHRSFYLEFPVELIMKQEHWEGPGVRSEVRGLVLDRLSLRHL